MSPPAQLAGDESNPMQHDRNVVFRICAIIGAIWIVFWVWHLSTLCSVLSDTIICFAGDLSGLISLNHFGLKLGFRLVAIVFGPPVVVYVLGAALVWAHRRVARGCGP